MHKQACHIIDTQLSNFVDMSATKFKHYMEPLLGRHKTILMIGILCCAMGMINQPKPALAFKEERVLAVVNGAAVTSSDVSTYQKILTLLSSKKVSKARALNEAIETHLKIQEAENRKTTPNADEMEKHLASVASTAKQKPDVYLKGIARKGIDVATYRKYLKAQLGWGRIVSRTYGKRVQIDEAEIQQKYEKIKNNPKRSVTLAILQPIQLPFDKTGGNQIVGARVADAKSIESRFKSCRTIRQITDDIYNVRILKRREVPLSGLPPKTREFLKKRGAGSIVQMNVNAKGGFIQMMAYCGNRALKAPIPSFDQYKNRVFFDQIQQYSSRHMKKIRDLAIIEIKTNQ